MGDSGPKGIIVSSSSSLFSDDDDNITSLRTFPHPPPRGAAVRPPLANNSIGSHHSLEGGMGPGVSGLTGMTEYEGDSKVESKISNISHYQAPGGLRDMESSYSVMTSTHQNKEHILRAITRTSSKEIRDKHTEVKTIGGGIGGERCKCCFVTLPYTTTLCFDVKCCSPRSGGKLSRSCYS